MGSGQGIIDGKHSLVLSFFASCVHTISVHLFFQCFFSAGACVNQLDSNGRSMLHDAIIRNDFDGAAFLLDHSADVDQRSGQLFHKLLTHQATANRFTHGAYFVYWVLTLALKRVFIFRTEIIFENNDHLFGRGLVGQKFMEELYNTDIRNILVSFFRDSAGHSPLELAIENGEPQILELLCCKGANLSLTSGSDSKDSPLWISLEKDEDLACVLVR